MATLHPFRAVRPVPAHAEHVASVPYDVINTSEARRLAAGNPLSFLHVIRPEIDLPEGTDEHDAAVYEKGAANLRALIQGGTAVKETLPSLYIYRLVMDGREQTGVYGCVSVKEYDEGVILKHEKTRPDKEDDRTRHILTQRAHAEPVMLTYRDSMSVYRLVDQVMKETPLYDFVAPDGVAHTVWQVPEAAPFVAAFKDVPLLYVADGHHRCKAASRAAEELRQDAPYGGAEYEFFPAVLFPMNAMAILPYNRIVYRLPESPSAFLDKVDDLYGVDAVPSGIPDEAGEIRLYLDGSWYAMAMPPTKRDTIADQLDVARLGEFILEPLLGIEDPRRDPNIHFVGGIRGTGELKRLVDAGEAQLAISLFATSIEELIAVSDAGLLMPPKSTWFEPKLRSGLLVHVFEGFESA